MSEQLQPLSKPRLSLRRFLFYFITLAALVLIYLKFSEIELIKGVFLRSNLFWLFGIIIVQFMTYVFIALNYQDVLRVKDLNVGFKELFPNTLIIQFLNQALPSAGFSGQAFFVQYLKKFGLSVAEGIGRALLELATLYMAFGTFFIVCSVMIFQGDVLGRHPEIRFFIYGFTFFAIVAIGLFFMFQKRGRGRVTRWMIFKIHRYFENRKNNTNHAGHVANIFDQFKETFNIGTLRRHSRPFWRAYLWQNVVLLLDVLTLYFISFSIGYRLDFSIAFIAFILTQFIAMLSFVPGALGVYEGGMTLILISFGVPAEPAFAMTLLLRAFTFWFPMPVGWILYRWHVHRQELEHPYEGLPADMAK